MVSETVRDKMGWDDSLGLWSLAYRAERYFDRALTKLFPRGKTSSSVLLEALGVDMTCTYKSTTFLIEVKVTRQPELFPPKQLQETIDKLERLERYRQQGKDLKPRLVLFTNYYLPPAMVERLGAKGLATLSFRLDDDDSMLRQRLADLIERSVVAR